MAIDVRVALVGFLTITVKTKASVSSIIQRWLRSYVIVVLTCGNTATQYNQDRQNSPLVRAYLLQEI